MLLPGRSQAETAGFAEHSGLSILELNDRVHAVEDTETGLLAVHFWQPGWYRSGRIACSSQASIVLHKNPAGWSLAIADPTQVQRCPIEIEISIGNSTSDGTEVKAEAEAGGHPPVPRVISKSERISVQPCEAGKVRLRFDPDGAGGASFHVEFGS